MYDEEKKEYQFVMVGFDQLDNKRYIKLMSSSQCIMVLYYFIRRKTVRAPMQSTTLNEVYNNYYVKKKQLATTISLNDIATKTGLNKRSIIRALQKLKKAKVIATKKIYCERNQKFQNVYILGNWKTYFDNNNNEKYVEYWALDDINILTDYYKTEVDEDVIVD